MHPTTASPRLALFRPPYREPEPITLDWRPAHRPPRGRFLVWRLHDGRDQRDEFEWLGRRPPGAPLVVILPPADAIARAMPLVNHITALAPRAVLPPGRITAPLRLKSLLAAPPRHLPTAVTGYLARRGLLPDAAIGCEVRRILELAPETASVSRLARRLFTSRRTLGRHFAAAGLPVPSHWLQFGRLLHVATRLQSDGGTIGRAAYRLGYPDGFTMSNQMKRLIGCRPTDVREHLGWEWIVEQWLAMETRAGAIDPDLHHAAVAHYADASAPAESVPPRLPGLPAATPLQAAG